MSCVSREIRTRQCYCTAFTTFRCHCHSPYRSGPLQAQWYAICNCVLIHNDHEGQYEMFTLLNFNYELAPSSSFKRNAKNQQLRLYNYNFSGNSPTFSFFPKAKLSRIKSQNVFFFFIFCVCVFFIRFRRAMHREEGTIRIFACVRFLSDV